jgi:beta-lactamase class C
MDLPSGVAPYTRSLDWPALAAACLRTPLQTTPGTRVQYSNTGYGLLAIVVERLSGQPFPRALRELVLAPLGVDGWLGEELPRPPAVQAGVRGPHAGTELEAFNTPFWRELAMPWGGLYATAEGALRLVRAYRDIPHGFLRPETRAEAVRNQADNLGGGQVPPLVWPRCPWGLGPELRDAKAPHWAPLEASPDSYGHAGASGCVAWLDPAADVAWAILGTLTADSGWLIRSAPRIGAAILGAAAPR